MADVPAPLPSSSSSTESLFVMPSLGADMDAGTLVAWRTKVGERVRRGDVVAEVETEKGVIEVEIFHEGVLIELLVTPGTKVPVGTPLARIGSEGALRSDTTSVSDREPVSGSDTASVSDTVSVSDTASDTVSVAVSDTVSVAASDTASVSDTTIAPSASTIRITPAARTLARARGLSLATLRGRGRDGVILRRDVELALASRPDATPAARRQARALGLELSSVEGHGRHGVILLDDLPRATTEETQTSDTPTPRSPTPPTSKPPTEPAPDAQARMRAAIAAATSRSKREIPHYYLTHTVELSAALAALEARNASRPPTERVLPAALVLRAVARALRKHPELNAHLVDGRVMPRDTVDLGVAISLRGGGLVAPSIVRADELDLDALMAALTDLVERARAGNLRASQMAPGSLTVTSLGERGVDVVVPVIFPPQVAIVGVGTLATRPWVVGDVCLPRPTLTLSLAADHRVTDGHAGARFLARVADLLARPDLLAGSAGSAADV